MLLEANRFWIFALWSPAFLARCSKIYRLLGLILAYDWTFLYLISCPLDSLPPMVLVALKIFSALPYLGFCVATVVSLGEPVAQP